MTTQLPKDLTPVILEGHVIDVLRSLPENSVQCSVSSPPYWNLRAYGTPPQIWGGKPGHEHKWKPYSAYWDNRHASVLAEEGKDDLGSKADGRGQRTSDFCVCGAWRGELGLEPKPEWYIEHLADVYDEVRRVLREDGTCWVNLGDSYTGSGKGPTGFNGIGDQGRRQGFEDDHKFPGDGIRKRKDLVGIPWLFAFEAQRRGWYLRSDVIWAKPNPMPESVTDRPTRSHEYVFLLTKSERYFYDADAVRKPLSPSTEERAKNHYSNPVDNPEPESKWGKNNWKSYPVIGRKFAPSTLREIEQGYDGKATKDYGGTGAQDPSAVKARIIAGARKRADAGGELYANLKSVWWIATQPYPESHFATFPEMLVETCLAAGTSEKGCCPTCESPYEREINPNYEILSPPSDPDRPRSGFIKAQPKGQPDSVIGSAKTKDGGWHEWPRARKNPVTTGWKAECEHAGDGQPIPCLVLDPFSGSGTTPQVARRLGRRSVGIELKPEYAELARKRCRANVPDIESFGENIPASP